MKISYDWLKDLVNTNLSPRETAEKLTKSGSACEGIEEKAGDFIFDFDLTSNRGDCFSHLGIARELAAVSESELRSENHATTTQTDNQNLVKIEDADLCRRFTGRIIRGVKIAPSPEWLKQRLEAAGERSINNVADITNYVMLELGNPMHAFDLNKLAENRIVVRRARNGEKIKTLDEAERKLDDSMLAICDAEKPVAVAGIMGGFDSSITDETTDVFLEVAYFDRDSIRQTSRKLKLSTEASHRFERGVDIENLIRASNRATELIIKLAGGEAGEFIDVYPHKHKPKQIRSDDIQNAVKRLTGLEIEFEEILHILDKLGIKTDTQTQSDNQKAKFFIAPTWRHDINIEEDLVEEVARIVGYDKIGEHLPPAFGAGEYQPTERQKSALRNALSTLGFNEAISYSFISAEQDEKFDFVPDFVGGKRFVTLQDSIIEGAVRMRSTLLEGLLDSIRRNFNFGNRDLKFYEIGKVFAACEKQGELPDEREVLALILTGSNLKENRAMPEREFDFYDAKGALETALSAMNLPAPDFRAADFRHLRKGQSAEILFDGKPVGSIGRLSDELNQAYKFKQPVFAAEIDLQTILRSGKEKSIYTPLPKLPSVVRDISLLVKRNITFADLRRAVAEQNFDFLRGVEFADVYEGKGVADDERSITLRFEFRNDEKTLRDEEVDAAAENILKFLESRTGAKQRF